MSLSETEKRALRSQQKLAYGSGQFPLTRPSKKPRGISGLVIVGIVIVGLIALIVGVLAMRL